MIDLKTGGVDVYDLDTLRKRSEPVPKKTIGLKKTADASTVTETKNKKLISSRDWFYSDLHRRLLDEYHKQQRVPIPSDLMEDLNEFE